MKLKKFTALCLCSVLLCGAVLTACKDGEGEIATADEVVIATADEVSTPPVTEAYTTQAQSEASTATEPETQASTKSPDKNNSTSNKPANKPASKPSNSSGSGSNSGTAQKKPVTCVITVDNKDHKVELGDVLTYTYYLKTPKKIENVQATVNYPGTTLKLLDSALVTDPEEVTDTAEIKKVFPVLGTSAIYNALNHNIIKFNASNISGIDFTKGDYLIKIRFEVISGINGSVSTKLEFMDEVGGKPYVDNSKISKDVEFKEQLTQ